MLEGILDDMQSNDFISFKGLNAPLEQTNSIESADIAGDHPLEKICQKFVHSDKYKCWRAEEKAVVNSLISQLLCSENPTIVTTTLFSHSENFVNTVDSAKSSATNLIGLKNRDLKKTKVVTTEIIETKINEDSDIIEPADVILMKAKTETKITARRSLSTGINMRGCDGMTVSVMMVYSRESLV
jgi:inactivated superfamily I helicase